MRTVTLPETPDSVILRRLRASGGAYLPGSDLGDPSAVAARVSVLRAAGYQIEHHPHLGYRLLSAPDRLIADDILSRLPECQWIHRVLVFESTASTNDVIAGMARDGAPAGIVVFAEEQTAGRGRLGRRWQSDPRLGLWFSLLLRPEMPLAQWPRLTLWIAFAIARGIRLYAGEFLIQDAAPEIALKWPNDLYSSGRKLAGILVESSLGENPYAVAGIGLNVNNPSFASPLDATATSLRIQTGSPLDRNALAASILGSLDHSFSLCASRFQEILDWASHADFLRGRRVSATAGAIVHEGAAEGLDAEAALLIRTDAGGLVRLSSGEVTRFSSATL
jgi:BirA family transcriptional regulator, biotin operon repressor / biotin---[acetyl-CoA-carboxylase] ligase